EQGASGASDYGVVPEHDPLASRSGGDDRRVRPVVLFEYVTVSAREVHDRNEDRGQEDRAGERGTQTEALFGRRGREPVTEVRTQRAGQNVSQPEGQHR